MKRTVFSIFTVMSVFLVLSLVVTTDGFCQINARKEINIPNIRGYETLKCDLHIHTVFSDGSVWPTVRVQEAWLEGLDAIAISDHIEYLPHKDDVSTDLNRSYEIAVDSAERIGLLLVKGTEITKQVPPGHFNALFIDDVNPVNNPDHALAIQGALDQGAFVFYNHPPFRRPDGKAFWGPQHTELYEKGMIHGIEIANGKDYYPVVQQWCLDKKLTMMGNSDVHSPITMDYDFARGEHRPMTLVFAKDKTIKSLKTALFERRTVVYYKDKLIGEEKYLKPLFDASIEILNPKVTIVGKQSAAIQIRNTSDVPFELKLSGESELVNAPESITLHAQRTVVLSVSPKEDNLTGRKKVDLPYTVSNLLVAPDEGLAAEISLRITFAQPKPQ